MIYLETSVALAHLLAEDGRPPDEIWTEDLVASRLLEYELWVRLNARDLARSHGDVARLLLARIAFIELHESVLSRALQPFPRPVRTLDALHLATAAFLRERGHELQMASYDAMMRAAAEAMGISVISMPV